MDYPDLKTRPPELKPPCTEQWSPSAFEAEVAYGYWNKWNPNRDVDVELMPFLRHKMIKGPWLRQARKAAFLSVKTLADRMKITAAQFRQLERKEIMGQVTIKKLQECADALDCDVVYALVPRRKVEFSRRVWNEVYPQLLAHPRLKKCDPQKRGLALADVARAVTDGAKFQRRHESQSMHP